MDVIVTILKIYFVVTVVVMLCYMLRHMYFSLNRLYGRQRMYYNDIYDSDLPKISVLVPMHNEEAVLDHVLTSLLACDYDRDKLEIIPINDHSSDATKEMLDD
ncbi:MAG: glycosyltransferase, partial [Oscillospiraceae bacterium]